METIGSLLSALDKKKLQTPLLLVLLLVVIFQSYEMRQIDHKLGNHITDTNRKIERLSERIDKLADRFEHLSVRFDGLYQVLLKNKQAQ